MIPTCSIRAPYLSEVVLRSYLELAPAAAVQVILPHLGDRPRCTKATKHVHGMEGRHTYRRVLVPANRHTNDNSDETF